MKALLIKGLEMPTGDNSFVDIRIQSNGTALLPCGMGFCSTYEVEEVETEPEK